MILLAATLLRISWLLIEVPYLRRFRVSSKQNWDRHSARFWDVANMLEPIGLVLAYFGFGRLSGVPKIVLYFAFFLLVGGIVIRLTAIYTLGRYFNSTVTIHNDHRIITTRLYRYLRHPAYTGALLAHLGLGLVFGSWISIGLSTIPFWIAALYRMQVEEKALEHSFGEEYAAYMKRTKRLIPRVY